jgi:hypothetical protein
VLTVAFAPAAGRKTTSSLEVFAGSALSVPPAYVPAASSTVCPGAATRKARSRLMQGETAVHSFESDPAGERKTEAVEGV